MNCLIPFTVLHIKMGNITRERREKMLEKVDFHKTLQNSRNIDETVLLRHKKVCIRWFLDEDVRKPDKYLFLRLEICLYAYQTLSLEFILILHSHIGISVISTEIWTMIPGNNKAKNFITKFHIIDCWSRWMGFTHSNCN